MGRDDVRAELLRRRKTQRAELAELTKPPEAASNLSFGKRIGEGTTEAVQRISSAAAARSIATALRDVDRALAKLDEGTYGMCDSCGRSIAPERLEAIPSAVVCVACRSGQ